MSEMGKETREITDSLDEVGNTTAAIGKGFAISAAALAALALISAYIEKISSKDDSFVLAINDPLVLCGMFLGGIFPFLVSSMTMTAVGDAAFDMIKEVRRQFKEIPGLLEGKAKPDTARCVDIATRAALRKMIGPGTLAVLSPVIIGFLLGPKALGGMLGGALICCVMMALTNLLFAVLAWTGKSELLFAIAVIADDITAAFATVAFVAFISLLVDRTYTATQYALLASIGTAGRTTLASSSGALVDYLNGDWGTFFILTAIMVIPSLICLWFIRNKIQIGFK
jgi:hypothetical protein